MDFHLHSFSPAVFLLTVSLLHVGAAVRTTAPRCPDTCDLRNCPVVSAAECPGSIVKDECNCCPLCQPPPGPDNYDVDFYEDVEDGMMTPNYVNASHKELCEQITCTRLQICTVNIQGIPICRCPSAIYCRQQRLRRRGDGTSGEVCGKDGQTYRSRCFLRTKECTENKRIKVKHDGRCFQGPGAGGKKKGAGGVSVLQQQRREDRRELRKQQRQIKQEQKREQRREEKKAMKRQERREKKRADKKEEAVRKPAKKQSKPAKKDSNKMKRRQKRLRRSRNKRGKKRRGRRSCSDGELDVDTIVV